MNWRLEKSPPRSTSLRRRVCALAQACLVLFALRPLLLAETPSSIHAIGATTPFIAEDSSHETALQKQIRDIARDARGKVSVSCLLPKSSLNCDLDPLSHPPMQSVFKLPLAIAILHQVDLGSLHLDQPVRFLPEDRIPHAYSPLQDKYPEAGVDLPLRELLRLTVSLSDNVAADILLRTAHGPASAGDYIASLGVEGFHLRDGERTLHQDVTAQYRNWFEPAGAVQLLRQICDHSPLTPASTELLLSWMENSVQTDRLQGDLPPGTRVAHKAGTSDVDHGIAHATNDIGLITLPDGRRLAIAVFITDSMADEATRKKVIARIARAAYDEPRKQVNPSIRFVFA
jgi:beta-lactamase class A